jgi:hypothetical protein
MESKKGQSPRNIEQLTLDGRRDFDVESMKRAKAFMKRSAGHSSAIITAIYLLRSQ